MAYDGYHGIPGSFDDFDNISGMGYNGSYRSSFNRNPPYPPQYGADRVNMPQPQMMPPTATPSNQYPELPHDDHNGSQRYQQQHTGRINEAVNSAVGDADRPSYIPPEVVSQITANVIQQLKTTGLDNVPGQQQYQQPQRQPPPSPPPPQQQQQPSPPPGSGYGRSQSPTSPRAGHEDALNYQTYRQPRSGQNSPRSSSRLSPVPQQMEIRESKTSQNGEANPKGESRPSSLSRQVTGPGVTTLEKIWGKFFENGKPTKRLGQFLRGIALHLIEDYPPGNTLVVTTEKMQKFYADTDVPLDPYPWQDIFDDRTSAISRLLREVEAEHHLLQIKLNERPDVPGLTPRGFERWVTLMVQVNPEKEFKRLQKAVLNMPISNPDDKKERFPKEIPRKLFPEKTDFSLRAEVDHFIMKHCAVYLPPITEEEVAAAQRPKRYLNPTVEDGDEEEEEAQEQTTSSSSPIERERKPYTAHPGGEKVSDGPAPSKPKHKKASSGSSRPRESSLPSNAGYRASDVHDHDSYHLHPHSGSATFHRPSRAGRSRSSSQGLHGQEYRSTDSDLPGHNGGSRYPVTSSASGEYYVNASNMPGNLMEEGRRYRELEREEGKRMYENMRGREHREREREKLRYHDHLPSQTWAGDEDYYRGMIGGGGSGLGGIGGYDYYGYR